MDGDSTVMDGAAKWQWMAQRQLGSKGSCDGSMMAMDDAVQWQWTAWRRLDGEGRCDSSSTAMDDKEWWERDSDIGTAGGGRDKANMASKIIVND